MNIFSRMGNLFRNRLHSPSIDLRPRELTRPKKLEEVLAAMQADLSRRAGRTRAAPEHSARS